MKVTGQEILKSEKLKELLINEYFRVLEIVWYDGSITSGLGRDIFFDEIRGNICVCEGLWSEIITESMKFDIEV